MTDIFSTFLVSVLSSAQFQSMIRSIMKVGGAWLLANGVSSSSETVIIGGATSIIIGLLNSVVTHSAPSIPMVESNAASSATS